MEVQFREFCARVCVYESCEPSIHSVHCFGFVRVFCVRFPVRLGTAAVSGAITSSDQNQ